MERVAGHRPREGRDQVEMLLEVVEHRFNLGTNIQEMVLPGGDDRAPLLRVGRGDNDGAVALPNDPAHDFGAVERVTNRDSGMPVQNLEHNLGIVDIGRREGHTAQAAGKVNAGVELKAVVPPLVVLAESGNAPGYFIGIGSLDLTYRQHGGVHDAHRSAAGQEHCQQPVSHGDHPVAVADKPSVLRQVGEVGGTVRPHRPVRVPNRFLAQRQTVPGEYGDEFRVAQ